MRSSPSSTLVLPSLYIVGNSRVIMGWATSFGGLLSNYNGANVNIHLSAGGLINFLTPVVILLLTYFFGNSQKSTYFLTFALFVLPFCKFIIEELNSIVGLFNVLTCFDGSSLSVNSNFYNSIHLQFKKYYI